jgi:ubiquinone/menaquinone biosynthesis C-methylase UbiE
MDIADLKRVDILWRETQPYLAVQVMEGYQKQQGTVLELGPFSGGITLELKRLYPEFEITIADESPETLAYIKAKIAISGLAREIAIKQTDLNQLAFEDCQFDIVVFRGALFFLRDRGKLLPEIWRVLKNGGFALVGGGHGKGVPKPVIGRIAGELRQLHKKLGGRWLNLEELKEIVDRSQLGDSCQITQEGGIWLNIRKQG